MKVPLASILGALALPTRANPDETGGFRTACTSLADSLDITGVDVSLVQFVANGTTISFPDSDASCGRPSQGVTADLCRVALHVPTSNRSGISMEAWLPRDWSGRFLSTGNGGLGGCIQYEDIEYAASLGFAAVGTNNGHDGMSGASFLNNPDVIADFAYRALHTGVVVGKQVSSTFYGTPHNKSYYLGCSTGGRQGFKEAQAFPGDFDGIVAGAPAFAFNNLTSWSCHFLPLTGRPNATTFVPMDMWPAIHEDILSQCDALDGALDGIIESPDLCDYDPSGLVCASNAANTSSCLTDAQARTVLAVFSPLLDPDGSLVYPAMQPGSETTGAPQTYYAGSEFGAADWFRCAIFADPSWDAMGLTAADYATSSRRNLFDIETWDGDLSAFRDAGGKLLHWHGLVDQTISSHNSPRYYEHVARTMGLGPAELDDFYRFFRVSGTAHCGGGPGASFIGNGRGTTASLEPEENVLMAMVRWVEEGVAPETVTGTAFVDGEREKGVAFKRKHCRWPLRNVYKGPGEPSDENAWECV